MIHMAVAWHHRCHRAALACGMAWLGMATFDESLLHKCEFVINL